MQFKTSIKLAITTAALALLASCSVETVAPELFGSISGRVIDAETGKGISGVNVTTSPPTSSILSNDDGTFQLKEVPTGQYAITAEEVGYKTRAINVKVREDETTSAIIPLRAKETGTTHRYFSARIIRAAQTTQGDSTFAEVEYEVSNSSEETTINFYEVYFDIHTSDGIFSKEVRDSSLSPGEKNVSTFSKYIRKSTLDSVQITGTWTE